MGSKIHYPDTIREDLKDQRDMVEKLIEDKSKILVYGIERVGLELPKGNIESELCRLQFEPFNTKEVFQDYDGVILFQGIFEVHKEGTNWMDGSYLKISCFGEELQRRKKQYALLVEKKGFICFLLIAPIIDRDEFGDKSGTDLAKYALNYSSFYRNNLGGQVTHLRVTRNEFIEFLKKYGAACTVFECYNEDLEIKNICEVYGKPAGIIFRNKEYFIPSLIPKNHELKEFFELLGNSLVGSDKKLSEEIPDWADEYRFEEEKFLIEKRSGLREEINKIDQRLLQFRGYKKSICFDGELLKESVTKILKEGFGFNVDDTDELKEDLKIVNDEGKPLVLIEVKGTNKGISREHINQADSHRERANLGEYFPSTLIVNTNIKKSNSLKDKYQEVAKEQIAHAVKMNILVMRSIDLLSMLYFREKGALSSEDFLAILRKENGWLFTSDELKNWEIRKE